MSEKPRLRITRQLNASPEKVYAAWTDPAQVARWWRPAPVEILQVETDARVGGTFRIVSRSADGERIEVTGSYREVVPNEKLVFTWAWQSAPDRESLVTVELQRDGSRTVLTLTHERFFDEAARDRHERGWNAVLDSLAKYLP